MPDKPVTPSISFGQWLHQRRQRLGLTQKAVAGTTGCAVITLQKIEAGDRMPSVPLARRLMAALAIDPVHADAFVAFARGMQQLPPPVDAPTTAHDFSDTLPHVLTPLIGRERELAQVTGRLRQGWRLVTLSGAPGVGKTRLALAAAHAVQPAFADGVCFVALEGVAVEDGDDAAEAVGAALAQATRLPASRTALRVGLRERHLLLLLDNFEHLLPAAELVGGLLAHCPWLSVLVTSRVALGLPGEVQVALDPLPMPDLALPAAQLAQQPAVALFSARAAAVQADFAVTADNAVTIGAICRQLDGLPLALELVAGQLNVLTPTQIRMLLEQQAAWPLELDKRRAYNSAPVTLHDVIASSYALLSAQEQQWLATLSIFSGGFTLAAAAAVGDDPAAALPMITQLRNKSLLQRSDAAGNTARFMLLTAIREFATARAVAREQHAAIARRHADYYLALAQAGAAQLYAAEQIVWLQRLEVELDNFRAALTWLLHAGDWAGMAALVVALGGLWIEHGLFHEGLHNVARLQAALDAADAQLPPALAVRLHNTRGSLAFYGDTPAAHSAFAAALAGASVLDDAREMAYALDGLAALAIAQGDYAAAQPLVARSLALSRAAGDDWLTAITLISAGEIARARHAAAEAVACYGESLALLRARGERSFAAIALHNLGQLAFDRGDLATAREHYHASATLALSIPNYRLLARILERAAELALVTHAPQRAALLLGAAAELCRARGIALQDVEQSARQVLRARVQSAIDKAQYNAAWQTGRSQRLADSITLAFAAD